MSAPRSTGVCGCLQRVALTCAGMLLGATMLVAPASAAGTFGDTLCLGVKYAQGEPLDTLPQLNTLGVRWVRDHIAWFEVETSPGQYLPFPADFQKRLEYYKANDIGVVLLLAYDNPKAYPDSAAKPHNSIDPEHYARYAAEMARRFKAMGLKFIVEIWNEPHNSLLKPLGGNWNAAPPSPWVDHYLSMVDKATRRIKAVDPTIKVLSDDDMWVIHYHFLERGLTRQIDGFGVHPYSGGGVPEIAAVQWDTDWTRPYMVVDKDGSFGSAMRRLSDFGQQKLGKLPEIWLTEWGWGVGEKPGNGTPLTEEAVATYLQRAMILGAVNGARATCWFSSRDSVDGEMGLSDNNGRQRPAFAAYQELARQLAGASYVCPVTQSAESHAYLFKDDKGPIVAAWAPVVASPGKGKVSFSRPGKPPRCLGNGASDVTPPSMKVNAVALATTNHSGSPREAT